MDKHTLEKKVKNFSKTIAKGDVIKLTHKGQEIARYEFIEYSIDSKTPIDWLRGCFIFEIGLKGRNFEDIDIEFVKN